ncbi:hypothetical protein J4411_03600 [Candidatus Pacearchaeota archaeon]|nr:hypothetical protein [Candidatus Pacearchaeota archaeon]
MDKRRGNIKGQVTIFVIIAIMIIVLGTSYFIFKDTFFQEKIPPTFEPVEAQFLNCLQEKTETGIKIIESKGGYIENPPFIPGSSYMPFSSELEFLGIGIPYWHSISGNNLPINQVPTIDEIQGQLANYLDREIQNCGFYSFSQEEYLIKKGVPKTEVLIKDQSVKVFTKMDLSMQKGTEVSIVKDHQVEINSELGSLYKNAVEFYNFENKNMVLENYSVDILRTYAPVDGFDLSCSPKIWNANIIFDTLKNATEANFITLKNSGEKSDYFNLEIPIDSNVRILNSKDWPSTYEVEPANSPVLVAKPIGNQPGLGILGFCYVPYHFVYNLRYPVLVQLSQKGEIFQFPLSITIEGNLAKKVEVETISDTNVNLCDESPTSVVTVNLVNSNGNPINGNISYNCFESSCNLGETKNGKIIEEFPQCANGKIIVNSEGYKENSHIFSTVQNSSTTITMDRIYEKEILLNIKNNLKNEKAIITINSKDSSEYHTIVYPEEKKILLSPGNYNIQVYVYDNSSIKFEATTIRQCVDVPSGIFGVIGVTHEECSTINIPEENITNVLVTGGNYDAFFLEGDLKSNKILKISVERYNTPKSLQELQIIYTLVEAKNLEVEFV